MELICAFDIVPVTYSLCPITLWDTHMHIVTPKKASYSLLYYICKPHTVKMLIEDVLLFNFRISEHASIQDIWKSMLQKFREITFFFVLLFELCVYLRRSFIDDFTVCILIRCHIISKLHAYFQQKYLKKSWPLHENPLVG